MCSRCRSSHRIIQWLRGHDYLDLRGVVYGANKQPNRHSKSQSDAQFLRLSWPFACRCETVESGDARCVDELPHHGMSPVFTSHSLSTISYCHDIRAHIRRAVSLVNSCHRSTETRLVCQSLWYIVLSTARPAIRPTAGDQRITVQRSRLRDRPSVARQSTSN